MGVRDTIQAFWGDKLVTVPEETLQGFKLPKETLSTLTTVGFPVDDRLSRYLNLGIEFRPGDLRALTFKGERYIVIGLFKSAYDYLEITGVNLCLNERAGDAFVVEPEAKYGPALEFMNTDVEKLLLFLMICLRHSPRMKELAYIIDDLIHGRVTDEQIEEMRRFPDPDIEYHQILDAIRHEFLDVDPEALSDPKHYWRGVLFDWSI